MSDIQVPMSDDEIIEPAGNAEIAATATSKVIEKLDAAVQAAEEENMGTSELIGLLFYYAHNLAQEARDAGIRSEQEAARAETAKAVN